MKDNMNPRKETFHLISIPAIPDCYGRFSETANREAITNGTADPSDPYSWITKSFEIGIVRHREATHICSFTPNSAFIWLQNYFAGQPNDAWLYDGDPEGLEWESGGSANTVEYIGYHDDWPEAQICESFTFNPFEEIDGYKEMDRDERQQALWDFAEETIRESLCNGLSESPAMVAANGWTPSGVGAQE